MTDTTKPALAQSAKFDLRPMMRVECGSLKWKGKADSADEAIIKALTDLPESTAALLRVYDGKRWQYLDFKAALKIAGYRIRNIKNGFEIL